jgi:hypothetical protein
VPQIRRIDKAMLSKLVNYRELCFVGSFPGCVVSLAKLGFITRKSPKGICRGSPLLSFFITLFANEAIKRQKGIRRRRRKERK